MEVAEVGNQVGVEAVGNRVEVIICVNLLL